MGTFAAISLAGALVGVFLALSAWDTRWLTGPERYRPWPWRPRRPRIPPAKIGKLGKDWTDTYYVLGKDGTRVMWRYLYPGHPALFDAIYRARPDLDPSNSRGQATP